MSWLYLKQRRHITLNGSVSTWIDIGGEDGVGSDAGSGSGTGSGTRAGTGPGTGSGAGSGAGAGSCSREDGGEGDGGVGDGGRSVLRVGLILIQALSS